MSNDSEETDDPLTSSIVTFVTEVASVMLVQMQADRARYPLQQSAQEATQAKATAEAKRQRRAQRNARYVR